MPLILIELPEMSPDDVEGCVNDMLAQLETIPDGVDWQIDPSVYVVRSNDVSDDVAVFAREADAEAFRATFDEVVGDVERVLIADPQLAAKMVAERMDDDEVSEEQRACDSPCPHCGGATAETCNDMDEQEQAKERATCSHCGARTYRDEECVCPIDDETGESTGDAEDFDEVVAELEQARNVDWSGVHWTHDEGAPIEAVDDEEGERFAYDDMIAALYVARNGYPWLLYEEGSGSDVERLPWQISAFKTRTRALADLAKVSYASGTYAFVFDGLLGIEQLRAHGNNGFRPREGAAVTIKQDS